MTIEDISYSKLDVPLTDFEGKPLNVGDGFFLPGRSGSSIWISKYELLEVLSSIRVRRYWNDSGVSRHYDHFTYKVKAKLVATTGHSDTGKIVTLTSLGNAVKV